MPEKLTLEKLRISEKIDDLIKEVSALNIKVGIQNGRVGKLENWRFFLLGMGAVLSLLVIPIFISIVNTFIK